MLTFDREEFRRLLAEELAKALAKSAAIPPAAPAEPDPPNFGDPDLCRRWNRSRTYVQAIRRDGHLHSVKFGARWVTPLSEVRRVEAAGLPSIGAGGRPKQPAPGVTRPIFGVKP